MEQCSGGERKNPPKKKLSQGTYYRGRGTGNAPISKRKGKNRKVKGGFCGGRGTRRLVWKSQQGKVHRNGRGSWNLQTPGGGPTVNKKGRGGKKRDPKGLWPGSIGRTKKKTYCTAMKRGRRVGGKKKDALIAGIGRSPTPRRDRENKNREGSEYRPFSTRGGKAAGSAGEDRGVTPGKCLDQ